MKIAIIEDDFYSQKVLSNYLRELKPDAIILDPTDSIETSIVLLNENDDIDLIFCDIKLKDGYCFDIFQRVDTNAVVVFVTAFERFAIKAFDYNCIAYLLKPISKEDLAHALLKFDNSVLKNNLAAALSSLESERTCPPRIAITCGAQLYYIKIADIAWLEYIDGNVFAYCMDGKKGLVHSTLCSIKEKLDPTVFFQINRSEIINLSHLHSLQKDILQRYLVILEAPFDEAPHPVSRDRVVELKRRMKMST